MKITISAGNSILRRSLFAYLVILTFFFAGFDFKNFAQQYSVYLSWKCTADQFKDFKTNVLYYDSLVRLDPKNAEAYAYLGQSYYYLQEFENAIAAYKKAIALKPEFYPWKKDLASIYDLIGRKENAEDLLRQK